MDLKYFLEKANKMYGDKYTYEKVKNVTSNKDTVTITCKKHGDFNVIINNFFSGRGCSKCNAEERIIKNKKNAIERAKKIHGNRYDYSEVSYLNQRDKVKIICPKHGAFYQSLYAHINGEKCPLCSKEEKILNMTKPLERFIEDARVVHGEKYDYSKVQYINDRTKVCIICPKHGEFWQTPNSHLQGSGCPKCSGKNRTTEDYVRELKEKFGDIYDYSKVDYKGSEENVTLIYKGREITAKAVKFLSAKKPMTFEKVRCVEDFIRKANAIHNNKYDYSKVEYVNQNTKICIICPQHGEFWQTPYDHLQGCGCKKCKLSNLEDKISSLLKREKIEYIYQYYPDWLSKKFSHQSFDFYLPKYNVAIECQGIQHYKDNNFFADSLEKNIERDYKKNIKSKNKLKILYFLDKHISMKKIIDNEKYKNIYTKENTFKNYNLLLENIKNSCNSHQNHT